MTWLKSWIARLVPPRLLDRYFGWRLRSKEHASSDTTPTAYWTQHTVHVNPDGLNSREQSLEYFKWRCSQYPGYLELMPVEGHDGNRILDYGCGPGHDLIGFLEHSSPELLVGADVSPTALELARQRVRLHPGGESVVLLDCDDPNVFLYQLGEHLKFDYVHCSGVLHHVANPTNVLRTMKSVLAPNGRIRLMLYNRDSIWRNFYVPYVLQGWLRQIDPRLELDQAFQRSTDGPSCPIADSYNIVSISALAVSLGMRCEKVGTAISAHELDIWRTYSRIALSDRRVSATVREFMRGLTEDDSGVPLNHEGWPAGINLVVELTL